MLLDMVTADAAARHGQETAPVNHGSFLVQMPLSILGSVLRRHTPSLSPATIAANDAVSPVDISDTPTPNPQSNVMTAPDTPTVSPVPSRPASSGSSAADGRRKKRFSRSKTSYLIAKPVQSVNHRSKLHIRPKVLLQLHQVLASQRPKPIYEVIPFSLLPQRSTRRLARNFNTRERLGPNDLLIVKVDEYNNTSEEARSEDEQWGSQEVIGVITPGKSEKGAVRNTEICMNDGMSRWEVTQMPNGGLEFNSTDDHGLTLKARWVLKPAYARRVSGMSTVSPLSPTFAPGQEDKKFTFSTISPTSRRHPIIATMTRTRIDVNDSYAMPSATSPGTPSVSPYMQSPAMTPSSIDMNSFMDNSNSTLPIETDAALRRFIIVSGIWVASQHFHSPESSSLPSPSALDRANTSRPPNTRTVSLNFLDSSRSASPASTLDENRRSIPKMFRGSTNKLSRRTSFTELPPSPSSIKSASNASPALKTRSRRANSTGNAQLRSMTGSMRKRYGLAFEDEALPETEEERHEKRSVELLRIKELALPSPIERPSMETPTSKPPLISYSVPPPIIVPPLSTAPTPLSAPLISPPQLSPLVPDPERSRKTQSVYNPVTTAGLWDSGVTEGPGLKARPTSKFVINERKRKQEKKSDRSKSKDDRKEEKTKRKEDAECLGLKRKSDWYKYKIKLSLKDMFKREGA